jgi:hypothetical protein
MNWLLIIGFLILGMLLANMLKNVCGCKNVVEGKSDAAPDLGLPAVSASCTPHDDSEVGATSCTTDFTGTPETCDTTNCMYTPYFDDTCTQFLNTGSAMRFRMPGGIATIYDCESDPKLIPYFDFYFKPMDLPDSIECDQDNARCTDPHYVLEDLNNHYACCIKPKLNPNACYTVTDICPEKCSASSTYYSDLVDEAKIFQSNYTTSTRPAPTITRTIPDTSAPINLLHYTTSTRPASTITRTIPDTSAPINLLDQCSIQIGKKKPKIYTTGCNNTYSTCDMLKKMSGTGELYSRLRDDDVSDDPVQGLNSNFCETNVFELDKKKIDTYVKNHSIPYDIADPGTTQEVYPNSPLLDANIMNTFNHYLDIYNKFVAKGENSGLDGKYASGKISDICAKTCSAPEILARK